MAKVRALEAGTKYNATQERIIPLRAALYNDLHHLDTAVQVNVSVLKFTNIGKDIKYIFKNKDKIFDGECVAKAEELISKWTKQIKQDEQTCITRNVKGGKVLEVPKDKHMIKSNYGVVPEELWTALMREYNNSQLFAINYAMEQFQSLRDTKIVLIQGTGIDNLEMIRC